MSPDMLTFDGSVNWGDIRTEGKTVHFPIIKREAALAILSEAAYYLVTTNSQDDELLTLIEIMSTKVNIPLSDQDIESLKTTMKAICKDEIKIS